MPKIKIHIHRSIKFLKVNFPQILPFSYMNLSFFFLSLMNLVAVMASVEEPNSKQKQNSKTRRTDSGYFELVP
jgi:hypothetical protein